MYRNLMFGLADKTEGVVPLLVQETPGLTAPAWPGPVLCHHQHYPDVTHTLVFFSVLLKGHSY